MVNVLRRLYSKTQECSQPKAQDESANDHQWIYSFHTGAPAVPISAVAGLNLTVLIFMGSSHICSQFVMITISELIGPKAEQVFDLHCVMRHDRSAQHTIELNCP